MEDDIVFKGISHKLTNTISSEIDRNGLSPSFYTSSRFVSNAIPEDIIDKYVSDPIWNAILKLCIPHVYSETEYFKTVKFPCFKGFDYIDPDAQTLLDLFGYKPEIIRFQDGGGMMTIQSTLVV